VTVNPLMGYDAVAPFIENPERGAFILCLTSNPSSRDLQYFSDGQYCLYEKIARLIDRWNVARNCGLVAGATHPEDLKRIRRLADVPFLIPGLGAQGGNLVDSVQNGTDEAGGNALFNSSRGIIYASSGQDFARAASEQAEKMRVAINRARTLKIRGPQNG
jgi:orotidine-5'-phosphate decarboxylase